MSQSSEHPPTEDDSAMDPPPCPNCGAKRVGSWCHECGQNNRTERLRLKEMLGHAFESVLDLEAPIFRTFFGMMTSPGKLCRRYVGGHRKRYTSPIRYCILMSALYVLVLTAFDISPAENASLPGVPKFTYSDSAPVGSEQSIEPAAEEGEEPVQPATEGDEPGQTADDDTPNRRHQYLLFFAANASHVIERSANILMILVAPFTALGLIVLYRRQRLTYAEHLSFAFFVIGQVSFFSAVTAACGLFRLQQGVLISAAIEFCYLTWAAWAFYRLHILSILWRQLVLTIWNVISSVLVGTAIAVMWFAWLIATGEIDNRI